MTEKSQWNVKTKWSKRWEKTMPMSACQKPFEPKISKFSTQSCKRRFWSEIREAENYATPKTWWCQTMQQLNQCLIKDQNFPSLKNKKKIKKVRTKKYLNFSSPFVLCNNQIEFCFVLKMCACFMHWSKKACNAVKVPFCYERSLE